MRCVATNLESRQVITTNKIFLSGNLTRAPEINSYGNTVVAKTAIAVARPFKQGETDFFNITAFNKTAEFLDKYFNKGSRIIIEGRLQFSKYKDKDGNERTSYDVIVDAIEFGESKKKTTNDDGKPDVIDDSDMPF